MDSDLFLIDGFPLARRSGGRRGFSGGCRRTAQWRQSRVSSRAWPLLWPYCHLERRTTSLERWARLTCHSSGWLPDGATPTGAPSIWASPAGHGLRAFLESVGAGLLAQGMEAISEGLASHVDEHPIPDVRVSAARVLFRQLLSRMQPVRFDVQVDDADRSGAYLLVEVLNFGTTGPNLRLSQDGTPSDGLLDIVLLGDRDRDLLDQYLVGTDDAIALPQLPVSRAREVTVSCSTACRFHIDDVLSEPPQWAEASTSVELSIDRAALTVLISG